MPAGAVRDLLVGGLIGGVSGTVVFLPQICLLFFLITILEDTGYLARAAFVMDRLLCRFGLPGYAFVPLLSSHACAIPGHPRHAPDSRSPRPLRDDPGRAVHELLGAPAGLRPADQLPLRRPAAPRRHRLRRLLSARRDRRDGQRLPRAAHAPAGQVAPDGARAADLQVALAAGRVRQRLRAGLVVPAHRRHGDSRDLLRDVVALGLSEGRAAGRRARARGAGRGDRARPRPKAPRGSPPSRPA